MRVDAALFYTRMTEASVGSVTVVEFVARQPLGLDAGCHYHLADAVATLDGECTVGVVYKYNTY